jgi:6-phosphogluconolactonase
MRLCARIMVGLLVLVAAVAATARGSASASSDVVGHVYVNDNTAGTNTIAAFDRHANGTLTPMDGSPFAAGGAGTGTGIGSQGALQITGNGKYLLAVDAGSNEISVLRIKSDGKLRPVEQGPVSSGGIKPVSIAVDGKLVYVANAGDGGSNYTGFTLHGGHLRPLAGSTVPLPDGSQPGDVLFNGDGTKLVGTRVGTSLIDSFTVGENGRLTAAPGSPFAAQGLGPFGSEFRPTNPTQLFVSNAHNVGPGTGTISAFSASRYGTLTSIGSSPFPNLQTAPCWVEISHDGQVLFAVNTGSGSISRLAIARDGSLSLLGNTPLRTGGAGAQDARLAPDGRTLWVVETAARAIAALAVSGGNLNELPSSPTPLPAGSAPFGIVVT